MVVVGEGEVGGLAVATMSNLNPSCVELSLGFDNFFLLSCNVLFIDAV